jgi:nitroreductase
MTPITPATLHDALHWRYATKKFDSSRTIAPELISALEDALVMTPSSFGLQPWKFFFIKSSEVKAKLQPLSWNQEQVTQCSHHVVLARKHDVSAADIDAYLDDMCAKRGVSRKQLKMLENLIKGFHQKAVSEGWLNPWADKQVYIALGQLMMSAAVLGIDACPMEGIDPAGYDQVLGLPEKGYRTVVACPIGYRAADDKYAVMPKVRFSAEKVIEHI